MDMAIVYCYTSFAYFRFENTIVGQFFGHTHSDTVKIYTDDDLRPTK